MNNEFLFNPNSIFFYVEKFEQDNNTILIDFVDSNEFFKYNSFFGNAYDNLHPSMILVKNYTLKKVREGVTYDSRKERL